MQAYMKSALPFYGVPSPVLRKAVRPLIKAHPLTDRASWERTIRTLWHEASKREERYAAIEIAGHRLYRVHQTPDAAAHLYRELITTGAWWDLVDAIAPHLVGAILRSDPGPMGPLMRAWASEDDLWLRRASIICQLDARASADVALLTDAVDANLVGSPYGHEFFIRKAIGWALRQHARHDPHWVGTFVADRGDRLAPLSRREALKHLH